jgi:uncharacterized membrane protein
LAIERKGKAESISRDEVKNIWRVKGPSRKKQVIFAAIGGTVGAFFGLIIALELALNPCNGSCAGEEAGAIIAVFGLPTAGVFAGRALAGSGERTLIYSAP